MSFKVKKGAKTSLKRKDVFFLNTDSRKLVEAIEKAGGNIKPALERAARKSLPIVQRDFKSFISQHHSSGETEQTLADPSDVKFVWGGKVKKAKGGKNKATPTNDSVLQFSYGFEPTHGFPALFLDIGTTDRVTKKGYNRGKIKGHFFIYYGVENNLSQIHKIQNEELSKILKELT